jgi:hypothetical protein
MIQYISYTAPYSNLVWMGVYKEIYVVKNRHL